MKITTRLHGKNILSNLVGAGSTYTPVLDNSNILDTTFYATQTIGTCSESLPDSSRIQYIDIPLLITSDILEFQDFKTVYILGI